MDDASGMVRKYVRRERLRRGWSQTDLARAAGIKSKTTVVTLEGGRRISEGYEGAIEEAFGWQIGSLDRIRSGGEPILAGNRRIPTLEELRTLPLMEILKVLDRAEELSGKAAREQLRNDIAAYLSRSTQGEREINS
jgi:transcriptional regulator with XRE-family HTH domain